MARAGINWARGLDELGSGLLRQVDIGNRAYEDAAKKEAERRAETRQMAAERRALTAQKDAEDRKWEKDQELFGMESERWVTQQKLLHGFRGEESEVEFERLKKLDEIRYGRDEASKMAQWRRERYAKIQDAISAAKSEEAILTIKNNVKRAESADDSADNYAKALAKAISDGDTAESDRLARSLEKAELERTEAWARIPGVDPLTSRQPSQVELFSVLGGEIADKISLQIGDKLYVKALLAIKDGKKDSADYQAAVETIDAALERIYETNPVLNNYSNTKKRDLRKYLIEKTFHTRSQGVTKEDESRTDTDLGDGNVGGTTGFRQEASVAIERLSEMSEEDLINSLETGALAAAEELPSPDRPGRGANPKLQAIQSAKQRDPAHLLDILKEARNKPAYGSRRDKIDKLIGILEGFLANSQASVLPREFDTNQGVVGVGGPPSGMLSQGPGMIFEADQMPMDARSVNARYTA